VDDYPLVPPREKPAEDNAPGPFYVTVNCITCQWPIDQAPCTFAWSETKRAGWTTDGSDHCRVAKQPITPEEIERTIQAAVGSCVSAIRYRGTDPKILDRFRELEAEYLCDAIRPFK
jgi:hypothetical protein